MQTSRPKGCLEMPDLIPALVAGGRARKPSAGREGRKRRTRADHEKPRVLIIGVLRELALYRAEVLRQHGFIVHTPESLEQASAFIERGDLDVVVLSYTLPSIAVEEITEQVREQCPECRIIAIADSERPDRRIAPDAVALAHEGPPALIAALRQVLRKN